METDKTKEAIECLRAIRVQTFHNGESKWTNAIDLAIDAIEKRTPRKPIYKYDGNENESISYVYRYLVCPSCKSKYEGDEYAISEGCLFCDLCGQAFDWTGYEGR